MKSLQIVILPALAAMLLALAACHHSRHDDPRLDVAAALCDSLPIQALQMLDSIGADSLSEPNRQYCNLLKIKAADKAYIPHTSDTLINKVIAYYTRHDSEGHLPEALYYGGRVNSDLGDYPAALHFFQQALDALEENKTKNSTELKCRISSQTGRLMIQMRLYSEAKAYIKEALKADSILGYTYCLVRDNQQMGIAYMYSNDIDSAKLFFNLAKKFASSISKEEVANMDIYLAEAELRSGNIDSALYIIRYLPDSVSKPFLNLALANASDIYLRSGALDSAFIFSDRLIHSSDPNNQLAGYSNILSPTLIGFVNPDSLPIYFSRYNKLIQNLYDQNESQLIATQISSYNYKVHDRSRQKAEEKKDTITLWLHFCIFIILILVATIVYVKIKSNNTILQLNSTLLKLDNFGKIIEDTNAETFVEMSKNSDELKIWIADKLKKLETEGQKYVVPAEILNSEEYNSLQEYITNNKLIGDDNQFWQKLKDTVNRAFPKFFERINTLTRNKLKEHEIQCLLLIKCGITPTQQSMLLGLSKSGISSRRDTLSLKILGEKTNLKTFDNIIKLL